MNSIVESWHCIDTWLQTFAPTHTPSLFPGITEEALEEAEEKLGLTLPADFKASYRIHNGAQGSSSLLMGELDFYPLAGVIAQWEMYQTLLQDTAWAANKPRWLDDKKHLSVQPVWRHPGWIGFTGNGAGDGWCLDLAPDSDGISGQVLDWSHEVGVCEVLFPSFEALLSTYAAQLEAGLYMGCGSIIPLKELTHLQERRTAFQEASTAQPLLKEALANSWGPWELAQHTPALFKQVLQREEAPPETRFFAYYGLITLYTKEISYVDAPYEIPLLFERFESDASRMPPAHWVHEEVTLLKPWSIFHDPAKAKARRQRQHQVAQEIMNRYRADPPADL